LRVKDSSCTCATWCLDLQVDLICINDRQFTCCYRHELLCPLALSKKQPSSRTEIFAHAGRVSCAGARHHHPALSQALIPMLPSHLPSRQSSKRWRCWTRVNTTASQWQGHNKSMHEFWSRNMTGNTLCARLIRGMQLGSDSESHQ